MIRNKQLHVMFFVSVIMLAAAVVRGQLSIPATSTPQRCQITSERYEGANVQVLSCFAQPDPVTGKWEADLRLLGAANAKGEYKSGYALLVESQRDPLTGEELTNRFGLWDFKSQKTILVYGDDNPGIFGIPESLWVGQHIYASGFIQAGGGYYASDWSKGISGTGTCSEWRDGLCVRIK